MANFFQKATNQSQRNLLISKYNSTRLDLLIIFAFTLLNIFLLSTGGNVYMLFSASIPYAIADIGMILCGKYPAEFYTGDFANMNFLDGSAFLVFVLIAVAIAGFYLLAFFLSKNGKVGWMIFSLVFMCIDTLFIFGYYEISAGIIPDVLMHVFLIVWLATGISAYFKLKKLPEEPVPQLAQGELSAQNLELEDSKPLRTADFSVKSRTFLEYEAYGHKIIYRRVKKTNELVIDGKVYAEYIALLEFSHMLTANLDGHVFSAGCQSSTSTCFIMVDGNVALEKIRLV